MGEHFCNSVGILQQFAAPSTFPGFDKQGGKSPVPPPSEGIKFKYIYFLKVLMRATCTFSSWIRLYSCPIYNNI